jgi:hypothetical protein
MRARRAHALGMAITISLGALNLFGNPREHAGLFLALNTIAFVAYLGAYLLARRGTIGLSRRAVVGWAIAARLAMIPLAPSLTDDPYRYVWDGRLVASGINPYLYAPSDTALARFHDGLYAAQGYKEVYTIYPPLVELIFGGAYAASALLFGGAFFPAYYIIKAVFVAADLAAVGLLAFAAGLSPPAILLYAWNPRSWCWRSWARLWRFAVRDRAWRCGRLPVASSHG